MNSDFWLTSHRRHRRVHRRRRALECPPARVGDLEAPPLGSACTCRVALAAPTDWLTLIQPSTRQAPTGRSKKPIVSPATGKLGKSDGSIASVTSDTPATRFCTVVMFLR